LTENRLITRVLAGDATAERELYEQHVDRVYRLAYRMTGDETMAEDCTQETFIRAFDRLEGFRGQAALSTWLHSIAVSVVLNSLRKIKRLRSRETGLEGEGPPARATAAVDSELRIALHRAIDTLPDGLRIVFLMHDVEGYRHHEIAAALDLPVGTSKSRLFRARAELRAALDRNGRGLAEEEGP
jgi:RNA polymerase sigma-70 factor (ECF subfamily)